MVRSVPPSFVGSGWSSFWDRYSGRNNMGYKMEPGRGRVESDKRSFIVSIKIMIILSVKWLTHFSRFAPLKVRYWSQEGNMAPKPKSKLEHVPPQLNQGDSRGAKDGRVYRH